MHGYICTYRGKRLEVYAESKYQAQLQAAAHFKAKKSYDVDVWLAEKPDGSPVIHSTAF